MKTTLTIIALALTSNAQAQFGSTVTSYGNSGGMNTTTIYPTGNGYNYSSIGSGGPHYGGVIASPGTTVTPTVGRGGIVTPIVTPAPSAYDEMQVQNDAANAALTAQCAAVLATDPPLQQRASAQEQPLPKPKDRASWIAWCKLNGLPNQSLKITDYNNLVRAYYTIQKLKKEEKVATK